MSSRSETQGLGLVRGGEESGEELRQFHSLRLLESKLQAIDNFGVTTHPLPAGDATARNFHERHGKPFRELTL